LIVAGFIASLKVAVTAVLGHIPTVRTGVTEITVGGAHASLEVVKLHARLLASATPYSSIAPVVIVAVYVVLSARPGAFGVKVKIVLVGSEVIAPATETGGVPAVKVNVVALIVAGCIGRLKVAVTAALGQTPTAPARGTTETVGAAKSGLVPGLQHPGLKMSSRSAKDQIAELLYLRMTVILLPLGFTAAAQ
jgi:hypothetical protein